MKHSSGTVHIVPLLFLALIVGTAALARPHASFVSEVIGSAIAQVTPSNSDVEIVLINKMPDIISAMGTMLMALGTIIGAYFAYRAKSKGDDNSEAIAKTRTEVKAASATVAEKVETVHTDLRSVAAQVSGTPNERTQEAKQRGIENTDAATALGAANTRAAYAEGQHKGVVDEQQRGAGERLKQTDADTAKAAATTAAPADSTIGASVEKIADAAIKIAGVETKETK